MKVALMTTDLGLTGIPRYVEILAASLPKVGDVQVEVIAMQPPMERRRVLEEAGIPVHVVSPTGGHYSRMDFIARLKTLLLQIKPDCLHTNLWNRGLMASWVAYRLGIPEVVTWHYWMHRGNFAQSFINTVKEIIVAHAQQLKGTHFIAIGSHIRRLGIKSARIHNILTGIPVRPAPVWKSGNPLVVLQAAKLNPAKGQADLIRAVAGLHLEQEFEVWLAGDGPSRSTLEGLIKAMSLTNVRLLGWRRDVQDLMQRADLAVLPSYGEGLPLFVMESLMAGLPVVGYNIPPIKALVTEECGILVEPGDIASLSAALRKVLKDPELRRAMGAAAHRRAVAYFSDLGMAHKTLAVYKKAFEPV